MNEDITQQLPDPLNAQLREAIREVMRDELREVKEQFAALDEKVDRRLQDTRPIWESVQSQLTEVREEQKTIRADIEDIKTTLRSMERRIGVLSKSYIEVRAEQDDMDERISKLEPQPTRD